MHRFKTAFSKALNGRMEELRFPNMCPKKNGSLFSAINSSKRDSNCLRRDLATGRINQVTNLKIPELPEGLLLWCRMFMARYRDASPQVAVNYA